MSEPVKLITMTESASCKPTNLPITERKRGLQHVGKVLKIDSYNLSKGEVLFLHESIILLSQDQEMFSKVNDTNSKEKRIER